MASKRALTLLLSLAAVLVRSAYFIVTPLWLDFLRPQNTTAHHNTTDDARQISVCFLMVFQWGFCTLCAGVLLLVAWLIHPDTIGEEEKAFPKSQFLIMGFAMGLSSILFNYSVSGSRTAPYLNGILGNCNIPIQFITRYTLLEQCHRNASNTGSTHASFHCQVFAFTQETNTFESFMCDYHCYCYVCVSPPHDLSQ